MEISVFGTGYVGLVQAAALADVGHQVVCVDIDPRKIAQLQRGVPTIHEPGLAEMLERNLAEGRLGFTTQASDAVLHADIIFIAVGTPPNEDGSADLFVHYEKAAARALRGLEDPAEELITAP